MTRSILLISFVSAGEFVDQGQQSSDKQLKTTPPIAEQAA
jgi:uncharacterized protein YneF (UPF0154 family)